jgi:FAD/FMN-containing dehydrogenase
MAGVVEELLEALGADIVLVGDAVPERNRDDWSGLPPTDPLAVLRPRSTDQVAAALRVCHARGQPVVPQGGLTGLVGGARAGAGEVALSLERMVGVEEIDPATATMTVLAGTPLERVQAAADDAGFLVPLDLGARGSCAIGGNISTNAGGNRVIRYGMTREMVLGLEVVLADGTVLPGLNKLIKNNAGYDLKHLFIGSEGTLGVVTRATLRLQPKPTCVQAAFCALPSFEAVVGLLQGARAGLGPSLSAFEVMWADYYGFVLRHIPGVRPPVADGHAFYVLVEAQGTDEAADQARFEAWLERTLEEGVIVDAALAGSLADVKAFWGVRDAAGEFRQTPLGPEHISFDIGLPAGDMGSYVEACRTRLEASLPGIIALFYGHIGDGNLHIVAAVPGTAGPQPKEAVEEVVYGLLPEGAGTVSAEHGIGTRKRRWLPYSRSPEELAVMRTLKAALDPRGILNPGKVI